MAAGWCCCWLSTCFGRLLASLGRGQTGRQWMDYFSDCHVLFKSRLVQVILGNSSVVCLRLLRMANEDSTRTNAWIYNRDKGNNSSIVSVGMSFHLKMVSKASSDNRSPILPSDSLAVARATVVHAIRRVGDAVAAAPASVFSSSSV